MLKSFLIRAGLIGLLTLSAAAAYATDDNAAVLPGGASSLTETYDAWQISCQSQNPSPANKAGDPPAAADAKAARVANTIVSCVLAQVQRDKDSRQLVLSVELSLDSAGGKDAGLLGTLVLPFGVIVSAPIEIKADEKILQAFYIATCLPIGCIAPLKLEAATLEAFSSSQAVTIAARSVDGGGQIAFPIQAKGFASGLKRLRELAL